MKTKKRVLPALLLSLFASVAAPSASAAQFSNVYIFGDSLSDAGYYRGFLAAAGVPSSLVAIMGRYTTNPGPVWSELVAQYYGFTAAPSNVSGGTNYAQGGARVTGVPGVSTPPGQAQRPISTQIDEFLVGLGFEMATRRYTISDDLAAEVIRLYPADRDHPERPRTGARGVHALGADPVFW